MFASHCDARRARGRFAAALGSAALILIGIAVPVQVRAAASYPGALIPSISHPTAMAAGDYNADGVTDFAVLNYSTSTVRIMLAENSGGSGTGNYYEFFSFEVGPESWDIASGDLDGDGYDELVVTESLDNELSIWRPNKPGGIPDGSFWAGQVKGTWEYPVSVEIFDWTGDGVNDIVAANYWSDNIVLYRGDGTGNVSTVGVLEAGSRPIDLGVGDFDGDGERDLAVLNLLSDDVTIFLGQAGVDDLAPGGSFDAGPRPVSVAVDSLIDGKDDLVIANYYDDSVTALLSTDAAQAGGTLFEDPELVLGPGTLAGGAPRDVHLVDLDQDGNSDLLVALENDDQLLSVKGFGGSLFSQSRRYIAGFRPLKVLAVQADADGLLDAVVATHWTHGLVVLNGQTSSSGAPSTAFTPSQMGSGTQQPIANMLIDLNADGYLDHVVLGKRNGQVSVRKGLAPPDYFATNTDFQNSGSEPTNMDYGLFSSDQLPDIVSVDPKSALFSVHQARTAEPSLLGSGVRLDAGAGASDVAAADFDQDGDDDVLTFSPDTGRLYLRLVERLSTITALSFTDTFSFAIAQSDANGHADLRVTGEAPSAETGFALAMGGDFNDDGRSDYAVGSPGEGMVRIYYGSDTPSGTAGMVLTGSAANRFGASLAFGDIDNDGVDDLIVGVPLSNAGATQGGRVDIFRGNDDNLVDMSVAGQQAGENFGTRVVSGVDLNGDDATDWAASSPLYDGSGEDAGRVYLFWGNGLESTADLVIEGQTGGDLFGAGLGVSQDFTADGQPDLLVGAPGVSSESFATTGRIHVYEGGSGIGTIPFMAAEGPGVTAALGTSIAGIGDFNGDGVGDIAAGAPLFDNENGQDRGMVQIWFGGANADNTPDLSRTGIRGNARLGMAIAAAGDVRQRGKDNFLVSAPGYSNTSGAPEDHEHGRVYMVAGQSGQGDDPIVTCIGRVQAALFGDALAAGSDINGDGFPDWIIGAPRDHDQPGDLAGAFMVYEGGRGGLVGPGAIAKGDFNNDGQVDLVAVNSTTGEVAIFLNDSEHIFVDSDHPATEIFVVDGQPSEVATADLNGDGFDDLAIIRSGPEDVFIYTGNGDGTFTPQQPWRIGTPVVGFPLSPRRVYLEDFTGNGELDIATIVGAWGTLSIREGRGGLVYASPQQYLGASVASDIAFADLSGGGKLDVLLLDEMNDAAGLLYHRGSSTGKYVPTGVEDGPAPLAPLLAQNYPNPFNPKTLIRFDVPVKAQVSLEVYDVRGRRVASLVDEEMEAGAQQVEWTGRDEAGHEVAAGVYLYRLVLDGELSGQRKMVLVK